MIKPSENPKNMSPKHSPKPVLGLRSTPDSRNSSAPPVYRPQSAVQPMKPASAAGLQAMQARPVAIQRHTPAVYRPQPSASIVKQTAITSAQARPPAPPVYRPKNLHLQAKPVSKPGVAVGRAMPHQVRPPTPPVYAPFLRNSRVQLASVAPARRIAESSVVVQPSWRGILLGGALGLGAAALGAATLATGGLAAIAAGGLVSMGAAATTVAGAAAGHQVESSLNQLHELIATGVQEGYAEGAAAAMEVLSPWQPIFHNLQAGNFMAELQEFNEYRDATSHMPDETFICKFDTNMRPDLRTHDPVNFRRLVRTGRRFLWTYDVGGILSIGSPEHNKHAIVADNAQLNAAGTGQIKIDPQIDKYLGYLELERKAALLRAQGFHDDKGNPYIAMASRFKVPKPASMSALPDRVVLDFDSGHYHPSAAWKATYEAWGKAGFAVEKSATGRTV